MSTTTTMSRNGVDTTTLFATRDAIKANNEIGRGVGGTLGGDCLGSGGS